MTNHDYLQRIQTLIDAATSYNGQLHDQVVIVNIVTERRHPNVAYVTLTNPQKQAVQNGFFRVISCYYVYPSERSPLLQQALRGS
jgi:hypothetical protein